MVHLATHDSDPVSRLSHMEILANELGALLTSSPLVVGDEELVSPAELVSSLAAAAEVCQEGWIVFLLVS